jgi:regulator of sigma E protease
MQVLALILSLSILVFLHEMGHFLPARWFNTRVERFYLFFDTVFFLPGVNRFKFALFKKKVGHTEYGLGWFPFGGYVSIVGMFGKPEEPEEIEAEAGVPEEEKFRNKKPWQRLIILSGGITVNLILGYVLFVMILNVWGETIMPVENYKYGIACDSVARSYGFRDGDKLLQLGDKKPRDMKDVFTSIMFEDVQKVQIERDGQPMTLTLPEDIGSIAFQNDSRLFSERFPFIADSVMPGTGAAKAGLKKGDQIVKVNGDTTPYFHEFREKVAKLKNKTVPIGVIRDGKYTELQVAVSKEASIGVYSRPPVKFFGTKTLTYSFGQSLGRAWDLSFEKLIHYVKQFKYVFTSKGATQIGGIASIGSLFPEEWNWESFWNLTALLSIILAFMNLLPIPVFDGGYMLFTIWEMVTGKAVPDKILKRSLNVGMWIVLALFLYSNGNDLYRMVISKFL